VFDASRIQYFLCRLELFLADLTQIIVDYALGYKLLYVIKADIIMHIDQGDGALAFKVSREFGDVLAGINSRF
jgi:hypothetical protein